MVELQQRRLYRMDLRGQSETLCVLGATGASPVIKEAHMSVCVNECVLSERIWVVPQEYLLSHFYGAGVFYFYKHFMEVSHVYYDKTMAKA